MTSPQPFWLRRRFIRATALGAEATRAGSATISMTAAPSSFPPSDHFDGHRFVNPRGQFQNSLFRLLKWKLSGGAARWPAHVEVTPQPPPPKPRDHRIVATWVNHATYLLQTRHGTFLTDPVWSERAGPGSFGPRRVHEPGIRFGDLPKIDAILLSHDHYDHCDMATLRRLVPRHAPTIIAPLGHRGLLAEAGFATDKIVELDWWQSHLFGETEITLTPARHWTNRLGSAANSRLWGGFHLQAEDSAAWFAGDTGYDSQHFREIRQRLGAPRLALIPIGAYAPRWFMEPAHCNPAEAVQIHLDVGAQRSLAMHWGTFQLTDEARDDPPRELAVASAAAGMEEGAFKVLAPGASDTV